MRFFQRLTAGVVIAMGLLIAPVVAADPSSAGGAAALSKSPIQLLPDCLTNNVQDAGASCVGDTILHFTNLLLWAIAAGAFFYLLYGAFLYVTAFGDEAKVKTAKGAIKYALIGVIIATLANFMVLYLKDALQVTGVVLP